MIVSPKYIEIPSARDSVSSVCFMVIFRIFPTEFILVNMMPEIDGFSYCDKIRSLADCPILFLTAKTMENDITFGLDLGADDYLTKPFRIAELRARVNSHLHREHRERHTALTFDRYSRKYRLNKRNGT